MDKDTTNTLKIRVKFPGGAEFEAEGSQEFIEQQRTWFLSQLGKKDAAPTPARPVARPVIQPAPVPTPAPTTNTATPAPIRPLPDKGLWERLLKTEGNLIYPRRKHRQLTPQTAALLLIAGAKTLLNATNGYSALDLSKSLKLAGYEEGRLDRLLSAEMRDGTLKTAGSKRARTYILSDEGFARAFVLAEKLDQTTPGF